MRELRDYQSEAVQAVEDEWDTGITRTSVVLPTGTGKSTVIAKLVCNAVARGEHVVMLAHRDKLLAQMRESVEKVDPEASPIGMVIGRTNEPDTQVVAASLQTLSRSPQRLKALGKRHVILYDEAHHALAPSYLKVLINLGLSDIEHDEENLRRASKEDVVRLGHRPAVVACGFTATMDRLDDKKLGNVWQSIAFEKDIVWAINNGWLIEPQGKTVRIEELNKLSGIKTVAGDYNKKDLDDVMRASIDSTVEAILTHAKSRKSLVFAASVEHAHELASKLADSGIPSEAVVGGDSYVDREEKYKKFNEGELNILVTVQVLTEGADFPRCDCVVLARPTRSRVLYTQMIGRAVRPYTDENGVIKDDALILDLTGVANDQKLQRLTNLWGEATVRTYDERGEEVLPPPPIREPPRERTGTLQLEDINLIGSASSMVVVAKSRRGFVFIPGIIGDTKTIFLWPPHPEKASNVYVFRLDTGSGNFEIWRDNAGNPATGSFPQAVVAACEYAVSTGSFINKGARWRKATDVTPGQKATLQRFNVTNINTMTKSEASDMISGIFLDSRLHQIADALLDTLSYISATPT